MKPKRSIWWIAAFLTLPVLYFAAQFLPFYHVGDGGVVSLGAFFWVTESHKQTADFIALFYYGFRANDLITPLLVTQLAALTLFITALILKDRGVTALVAGGWGAFGLFSFLTTRSLAFSPVMVYGGFAGLIMLFLFLAALVLSAVFFITMYQNYSKTIAVLEQ